jgi:hypothetical protein
MKISPFFQHLRSAYQAEIDDLTFDSEGRDVLRQRLAERRKELGFLIQMLELSPEMVSVVLHQGFRFKSAAAMDHVLSHESEDMPDWDTLADTIQLTPWAQVLVDRLLDEPKGAWFLSVAAGLEYMYGKVDTSQATKAAAEAEDDEDAESEPMNALDAEEEEDARNREEAGQDWMVEQGFDRKD